MPQLVQQQLSLPERPAPVARPPFPLIASLAPLLASAAIWAVTQSPFALIFAVLSPIIAVASLLDSRWQGRRRFTKDAAARLAALAALSSAISARHGLERRQRQRLLPSAAAILAGASTDPTRWRTPAEQRTMIALGSGTVRSELALAGAPSDEADTAACEAAARLCDAPVPADAAGGVAIVGITVLARALARGYLVQLVHRLPPTSTTIASVPESGWEWMQALPYARAPVVTVGTPVRAAADCVVLRVVEVARRTHRRASGGEQRRAVGVPTDGHAAGGCTVVTIALVERLEDVPVDCRTVVRIEGVSTADIITQSEPGLASTLLPELVSAAQAVAYSTVVAAHARSAGLDPGDRELPGTVALIGLLVGAPPAGPRRTALRCPIGIGSAGVVELDLVSDGPHAVVGGTTGSGKSELLVTWVAGLAASYSPKEVTFLLVDFKGGAAFAPLVPLPHCVGVLTDLDQVQAQRAMESLRAELRHRERILGAAGVRDIADNALAGALPRLVIVVDEFAAMIDAFPELHAMFVDVAARGRSLGVHLILCTQRPSGVVRDSLLANCNLRLSLRVNNTADSVAVVGSDLAALLTASLPGRCVVGAEGEGQELVQIARTDADDVLAIAGSAVGRDTAPVRRPWLDPLPEHIPLVSLIQPGAPIASAPESESESGQRHARFVLGVEDVPTEQRQDLACYLPKAQGHLLVVGAHGAGKSTLASALVQQSGPGHLVRHLAADIERTWDELMFLAAQVRSAAAGETADKTALLLVIDDIDALYDRFGMEHQQEMIDALFVLVREGPSCGIHVVATAQRIAGPLSALAGLFGTTMMLRMPNRQEYALAGGESGGFQPDLRPGAGIWMGHRLQLALAQPQAAGHDRQSTDAIAPMVAFHDGCCYLIVSRNPADRGRSISRALTGRGRVIDLTEPGTGAAGQPRNGQLVLRGIDDEAAASVLIADPDSWQSNYTILQALRPRSVLVFDGCSLQEVRTIAQRRVLPPPLAPFRNRVWLLTPGGEFSRGTLP